MRQYWLEVVSYTFGFIGVVAIVWQWTKPRKSGRYQIQQKVEYKTEKESLIKKIYRRIHDNKSDS